MSKLSRYYRNRITPILDRIFRGGSERWIPQGIAHVEASSQASATSNSTHDKAIRYSLVNATAKCPKTITGNLQCFEQLREKGLTASGEDRWWQELLCSDATESSMTVACIHHGRVLHRDGAIIDRNNRLIAGISGFDFESEFPGNPLRRKQLSDPIHVPGTIALLTGFASHNYYHWLIDILPKLSALQRTGIPIDRFFIPQDKPFQRELVQAIGIDPRKIIAAKHSSHFSADRILASTWHGQSATPMRVQAIREGIVFMNRSSIRTNPKRIYISRTSSRVRRIENEGQLIRVLRSYNFKVLHLEAMTVEDQIAAYRSAEIIVAPHGAGLANLCFCNPGTRVLEITTPFRVLSLFTRLANAAGLEFHLHLGNPAGKKWIRGDTAVGDSNILVSLDKFEAALVPILE